MMICIRHPDGRFDMVKETRLEYLISTKQISGFRRASGWVEIGRHPIRKNSKETYFGYERRHFSTHPATSKRKRRKDRGPGFYRDQ